eukprot:gb/GECG01015919.1/.p1 GENE.gb/GECG01015919.1/~~gb/GECG01015919.1/.p1  ORF type:complete len:119 (+),score=8.78 gb/GECG01015919.1/:1-357(+)
MVGMNLKGLSEDWKEFRLLFGDSQETLEWLNFYELNLHLWTIAGVSTKVFLSHNLGKFILRIHECYSTELQRARRALCIPRTIQNNGHIRSGSSGPNINVAPAKPPLCSNDQTGRREE